MVPRQFISRHFRDILSQVMQKKPQYQILTGFLFLNHRYFPDNLISYNSSCFTLKITSWPDASASFTKVFKVGFTLYENTRFKVVSDIPARSHTLFLVMPLSSIDLLNFYTNCSDLLMCLFLCLLIHG